MPSVRILAPTRYALGDVVRTKDNVLCVVFARANVRPSIWYTLLPWDGAGPKPVRAGRAGLLHAYGKELRREHAAPPPVATKSRILRLKR